MRAGKGARWYNDAGFEVTQIGVEHNKKIVSGITAQTAWVIAVTDDGVRYRFLSDYRDWHLIQGSTESRIQEVKKELDLIESEIRDLQSKKKNLKSMLQALDKELESI